MTRYWLPCIKMLLLWTVITGGLYPLFITGIAQLLMPEKANGSIIDGRGSKWIGQKFQDPRYFWSRPSATDYNPIGASGSNLGPTSALLKQQVEERLHHFVAENYDDPLMTVPLDMLFASGSGLDPHISPEAANAQIDRVVKARNLGEEGTARLRNLVASMTERRIFGLYGAGRVNVFLLNYAIDKENEQ